MTQVEYAGSWLAAVLAAVVSLACTEPTASSSGRASSEAYDVQYEALSVGELPKCTNALVGTVGYVTRDSTLWTCGPKLKWVEICCDTSNAGAVAYASGTQTLLACAAKRWMVVPLPQGGPGPKGDTGAVGPSGPAGKNGSNGADGKSPLAVVVVEPEGAHCANGGSKVEVGLDENGNGTLDATEVTSSTYICDGFDGADAPVDDTLQDFVLSLTPVENNALVVLEDAPNAAQLSVALKARPHGAKGVRIQSSGPSVLVNGAGYFDLVFGADSYATPQTLTISTPSDQNLDEPADAVLTVGLCEVVCDAAAFTGTRTVAVDAREDDVQSIIVSKRAIAVNEEQTLAPAFDVRLAFEPFAGATEVISLMGSDYGRTLSAEPTSLAFTAANYATPRNVAVTGVSDANVLSHTVTLTLESNLASTPSASLTVATTDDDAQAIVLNSGSVTLNEGQQGSSFKVALPFDPGGLTVVSAISGNSAKVTVSPSTLTFDSSNYAVGQTVQVTSVSDNDVRDEDIVITFSATGVQTAAVFNVTVLDDDVQGLVVAPYVGLAPGSSGSLPLSLAFEPTSPVVISVSTTGNPLVTATPGTLTFDASNYATPQSFQISAAAGASSSQPQPFVVLSVVSAQGSNPPEGPASVNIPVTLSGFATPLD